MGQQGSYPSATFQLSVPGMRPQNAFTCTVGTTLTQLVGLVEGGMTSPT